MLTAVKSVLFFIFVICSNFSLCGSPQYDIKSHDGHPWVYGWPIPDYHADAICQKAGKRLCSSNDIHNFALQGRHHCELAWAYNTAARDVFGHIANSRGHKCFDSMKEGVHPHLASADKFAYWCMAPPDAIGKDFECTGAGEDYHGEQSVTKSGKECQRWRLRTPNFHLFPTDAKSGLKKNYCRNPYGLFHSPVCYLADSVGLEACGIECAPFGDFDECSVTVFQDKNFKGASCTFSVEAGGQLMSELEGTDNNCKLYLDNTIESVQVKGSFCHLFLYENDWSSRSSSTILHFSGYRNVSDLSDEIYDEADMNRDASSLYVFDASVEVTLGLNKRESVYLIANDKNARKAFFENLHMCSTDEVDRSRFFANPHKKDRALARGSTGLFPYARNAHQEKASGLKNTWCCQNEYPKLSEDSVSRSSARAYCRAFYRNDTAIRRGYAYTESHRRRVCTLGDLKSNLLDLGKPVPRGWMAVSPGEGGDAVTLSDFSPSSSSHHRVWCCDEDCLPLGFQCVKSEQCCSVNCVNLRCHDPDVPDFPDELPPAAPASSKMRLIVSLCFLFSMGFIFRHWHFFCSRKLHQQHVHSD